MDKRRFSLRWVLGAAVIFMLAALVVVRFDGVRAALGTLWNAVQPLVIGAILAYLVNLIMVRYERHWFPNSKRWIVNRTRRAVCMILAILTITALFVVLVTIIVTEFANAASAIGEGLNATFDAVVEFLAGIPQLAEFVNNNLSSWQDVFDNVMSSFGGGASDTISSVVAASKSVFSIAFDVILGAIFVLYALLDKNRVLAGGRRLLSLIPNGKGQRDYVTHALKVANGCFSRFIFGQCLEATILGTLCAVGGMLFGFPYAVSIGAVVGMTSIIPWLGAWIGGAVGAIMIFSVNPIQSIQFLIFLIVLQQIEGHLIYPNVVGQSVGIPSIWVFAAVVVGGSLFGIPGILLSVPIVSTLRELWMEHLEKRDARQEALDAGGAGEGGAPAGTEAGECA